MFFVFRSQPASYRHQSSPVFRYAPHSQDVAHVTCTLGYGYFALLHRVPPREHLSAGSSPESAGEVAATQTEGPQPEQPLLAESQGHTRLSALMEFLIYGGPLLLALAFGIALKAPLWLALCGGIGIAVVLAIQKKRPFPSRALLLKGANLSLVVAMFWIMAFQVICGDDAGIQDRCR